MSGLHTDAVRVLTRWQAPDAAQDALRRGYLDHLRDHPGGVWRSCVPSHLTASALVVDATFSNVLLTLHRKGGFWSQLGGHCERGDATLADAALREAREESGIDGLALRPDPVDLDRHRLSSAFGTCQEHLDVRYVLVAPAGARAAVSDESDDLRWFAPDSLPDGALDVDRLVARGLARVRGTEVPPRPSATG